ncbi:hypothetical protein [Clostridium sporogenes]|uniref:hypothetical protein n=1 Tax=Clostridium sporogenes TaxID=1509 RepID=UPI002238F7E8|nr:hypothetical protein [Clostridium sporogenes]MCW6109108.1 hypothetical protein [Clostridium sporogenes]
MGKKLFDGYNCFASALGQYFLNINMVKPIESIIARWTFDFTRVRIFDNVWFVGACVEPTDYLLQHDLLNNEGIRVTTHKTNKDEARKVLSDELKRVGSHIIMVDNFYMKSINWERMERFGYFPKHLPHFIIIIAETETDIIYQDPFFQFEGKMSKQILEKARCGTICNFDIDFEYYLVEDIAIKSDQTTKEKLHGQLQRFLENGQLELIGEFGKALNDIKFKLEGKQDFNLALNTYTALESVVKMRQSLAEILPKEKLIEKNAVKSLANKWSTLRKMFFNIYKKKDYSDIPNITETILQIREDEEEVVKNILVGLV